MYAPVETMVSAVDAMVARERVNEEPARAVCSDKSSLSFVSSEKCFQSNDRKTTTEGNPLHFRRRHGDTKQETKD
jgi:hypothetical protein